MAAKDSKIRGPILIRSLFIITLFYCLRSTTLALANSEEELSFCDKRRREYNEDRRQYRIQCDNPESQSSICCGLIKESLEDRVRQYRILCPESRILGPNQKCELDLLIIWDNSRSIGLSTFENQVKDFFRNLINSENLNVGPEGTHLAIITFSTQERTKVLLEFEEKTTKADLLQYINGLVWSEVEGDATRTGRALMLANQMFRKENPLNGGKGRKDVKDVVMILTDGKPIRARGNPTYGFYDYDNKPEEFASRRRSQGETKMANALSAKLHEKEIRVVGVFIGVNGDKRLLEQWTTTPSDAIQATKAAFDTVVSTMVDKSCKKTDCKKEPNNPECIRPGKCDCAATQAVAYLKPRRDVAEVHWLKPSLKCAANPPVIVDEMVDPEGTESPKFFGVGNHVISYTYKYQNGRDNFETHTCQVQVNVKHTPCGGLDFDPEMSICCCGTVYTIQAGWECCGGKYHNTGETECCGPAKLGNVYRKGRCPY